MVRILSSLALCSILLAAPVARAADAPPDCHIGAYRLADGGLVDIGASEPNTLRWRRFDGAVGQLKKTADGAWTSTYGWTGRPDGKTVRFSDCAAGRIDFDGMEGRRIAFDVTDTKFASHGVTLAGRLVLPKGKSAVPIVVLIHGSEHDSGIQFYALQRLLPAEGVGAFVYDKRGTGASGGVYSQDFSLLADDAVAAMREARRLAGARAGRVGYQGGSEGGWVAPIAANRAPVDFVIVCFGLAVTVIEEDQEEVALEMREEGHTPAEIADALKVAGAAEAIFASGFTKGFREFDALRAQYRHAPWYKDLHGDYTYFFLPYSEAQLRAMAPKFRWGTPFDYEPMPTLRADTTPQLWILGTEDYEAPSAETARRIKSLIADGKPFTLALYPGAEHGMTLFEKAPDGERLDTRFAPGYFAMMRDFARDGRLGASYGNAEITRPR
ncbi:MAG TPA: alpha/beta hydrolase [Rhizomicrobium sp.]|nr:alpha/beta hydrolase [Rhizomicrobium sp.]